MHMFGKMKGLQYNLTWTCEFISKLLIIICLIDRDVIAVRVSVMGVINPVKQGGLLSVSCEVRDFNNDDQVTIFRQRKDGRTQVLSVNEDILSSVDDNVFLATRHMADGAVIYFLTITQVSTEDEGEYSCKVSTVLELLAIGKVNVTVYHFPDEASPECHPGNLPRLQVGSILTMNCTSVAGNPVVDMEWSQSDNVISSTPVMISDGKVFSEIRVRISKGHQNSIFICSITNPEFPSLKSTCHVGPVQVISNSDNENQFPDSVSAEISPSLVSYTLPPHHPTHSLTDVQVVKDVTEQCRDYCAANNRNPLQWKIATLIAVASAAVFLICGIFLFVLLKTIDKNNSPPMYNETLQQREQLYTELNQKFDDKVYIALQRQALEGGSAPRSDAIPSDLRVVRKY